MEIVLVFYLHWTEVKVQWRSVREERRRLMLDYWFVVVRRVAKWRHGLIRDHKREERNVMVNHDGVHSTNRDKLELENIIEKSFRTFLLFCYLIKLLRLSKVQLFVSLFRYYSLAFVYWHFVRRVAISNVSKH